ncbi:MAG: MFS transporter [Desulfovermiculus sp.]|nr:MFS transporter [Desulfovermiculus sp.]
MSQPITNPWGVFALTSVFFLLSQFYRASTAVISTELIRDLELNASDLSLLSSAFFYVFALVQIPMGLALDRFGPRLTMSVLSLFGVAGALSFAWAETLELAIGARILLGLGMACNLMGPFKLLTLWFGPARFASLTTVIFSIGAAGSIVASSPLVALVQWVGWRWAFTLIATFHALLTAVFFLWVRDRPPHSHHAQSGPGLPELVRGLRILFGSRDYWIISVGTFCRYGIFAAIQTLWAGPYLMQGIGLAPMQAGNVILVLNLAFIVAGPLWGGLSDRLQRRKGVILIGLMGMGITLLALTFQTGQTSLTLFVFLFVAFGVSGSTGGIMYTHIKERMPAHLAGTAMTGINLFTMFGAAFFVHGLGVLMQKRFAEDAFSLRAFHLSFLLCAGFMTAVFVLYLFTRERKKTEDGI